MKKAVLLSLLLAAAHCAGQPQSPPPQQLTVDSHSAGLRYDGTGALSAGAPLRQLARRLAPLSIA